MKKLSVRTGEFQAQDGTTKGRYVNVGVMMTSAQGKDYILLDPAVSIAGLMALQQADAMKKGEQLRDRVMVGVFEEDNQAQQPQQQGQQGGYAPQQPPQQQGQGHYTPQQQQPRR